MDLETSTPHIYFSALRFCDSTFSLTSPSLFLTTTTYLLHLCAFLRGDWSPSYSPVQHSFILTYLPPLTHEQPRVFGPPRIFLHTFRHNRRVRPSAKSQVAQGKRATQQQEPGVPPDTLFLPRALCHLFCFLHKTDNLYTRQRSTTNDSPR